MKKVIQKKVLQKVLGLVNLGSCQKSKGEPCACEYATLLQSFHRGILSVNWCIAQNFYSTCSISVLFRLSFKTALLVRFLQTAIATSNSMNKAYNGEFVPDLAFQC